MAKITKIVVNYGLTYNLGNYNSVKLAAAFEVELDDQDDVEQETANAFADVKEQVLRQLEEELTNV